LDEIKIKSILHAGLSIAAIGAYVQLCEFAPGFDVWFPCSVNELLKGGTSNGTKAMNSALHELEKSGLLLRCRQRTRDGSYNGGKYLIYEIPQNLKRPSERDLFSALSEKDQKKQLQFYRWFYEKCDRNGRLQADTYILGEVFRIAQKRFDKDKITFLHIILTAKKIEIETEYQTIRNLGGYIMAALSEKVKLSELNLLKQISDTIGITSNDIKEFKAQFGYAP